MDDNNILTQLSNVNNFRQLKEIANRNYNEINKGTSRIVYFYSDRYVIKIAKNNKGLEQNKTESNPKILENFSNVIAKIINYDKSGKWVIQEFAENLSKDKFYDITGLQFDGFLYYLRHDKNWDGGNKKFYAKVNSLINQFELERFDIANENAWGIVNGKVVLRDYGLSLATARKLYGVKYNNGGIMNEKEFSEIINLARTYNTPIDADLINAKYKKGHVLDNIPKNTEILMIDSSLFEREKEAYGKVSDYKIAYHSRPIDDKYWNKQIGKGDRPLVLIEFDEDNNQLRVGDGNHRLNVYLNKNIKKIPSVLTIQAKTYLDRFKDGGSLNSKGNFKTLGTAKELGIIPKIEGDDKIALCECGNMFSYVSFKEDAVWQCPKCEKKGKVKGVIGGGFTNRKIQ